MPDKYQLCSRDQYGPTAILSSNNDIEELVKEGKKLVSVENVDNPLTVDEKKRNWDHYFVDLVDEDGNVAENAFFSGPNGRGGYDVLITEDDSYCGLDEIDGKAHFYLGKLDKEDWYAASLSGKLIESIDSRDLEDKTAYFIRKA